MDYVQAKLLLMKNQQRHAEIKENIYDIVVFFKMSRPQYSTWAVQVCVRKET